MKVYHPICHFANGERLYYILVDAKTNLFAAKKCIVDYLKEYELKNSTCGYITFGSSDILLRIWATEERLAEFVKDLRSNREVILEVKPRIIESIRTWYQIEMEKSQAFWASFKNGSYENLMNRKFNDLYVKVINQSDEKITSGIRFFAFLEEPYGRMSTLFNDLCPYLQTFGSINYNRHFKDIKQISIYSYQATNHQGVLIKGQTNKLGNLTRCIDSLTKRFNVLTTTCLCANKLVKESDELNPKQKSIPPLEIRKKPVIYNLLKSHDCYTRRFANIENATAHHERICEILTPLIEGFLFYNKAWWFTIDNLRKLYKWVVYQKNAPFKGFLMEQFVMFEKKYRNEIGPYVKKKQEIKNSKFEEVTWGTINRHLGELKEFSNFTSEEKQKVGDLGKIINACFKDRNDLMHGNTIYLFGEDKHGKGIWEGYVLHLVKLWFSIVSYNDIYYKYLSSLKFEKIHKK